MTDILVFLFFMFIVKYTGLQKKAKQDENNFKHRSSSRGLIPRAKIKTVKMTICIVIGKSFEWSHYLVVPLPSGTITL